LIEYFPQPVCKVCFSTVSVELGSKVIEYEAEVEMELGVDYQVIFKNVFPSLSCSTGHTCLDGWSLTIRPGRCNAGSRPIYTSNKIRYPSGGLRQGPAAGGSGKKVGHGFLKLRLINRYVY
jgi:hypothetical protein